MNKLFLKNKVGLNLPGKNGIPKADIALLRIGEQKGQNSGFYSLEPLFCPEDGF